MSGASKQKNYYWQPVSLDYLLSVYNLATLKGAVPLLIWSLLIAGSLYFTSILLSGNWFNPGAKNLDIINFFIANPAMIVGLLLLFWFGFEWGFIPVYLCSFMIAFSSRMSWEWALLVGFSFVLGLVIYALAYQSLRIPYTLRSIKSLTFFVTISFIASLASSMGSFIWSFSHQLSAAETLIIWKSWWSGLFLQSILAGGPLIFLFSPAVERLKRRYIEIPVEKEVSLKWIYGAVISIALTLVLFVFSGNVLGRMRVREVVGSDNMASLADILGALEAFEIISWISIALIITTGYGAIYIMGNWNSRLENEIRNRTKELNESERELKKSLEEKRILLKEVYHRVKNNLSQVHALLELQEHTEPDEKATGLLRVSRSRIRSMAMAHEALYKHDSLTRISLKEYIQRVIENTHKSFNTGEESIELRYKLVDTQLVIEKAIPLGLLINEILVNAHKHAFVNKKDGFIEIRTLTISGSIRLIIRDNGRGIPEEAKQKSGKSLGMLLIRKFSQQLSAEMELQSNEEGTSYSFTFPVVSEEVEDEKENEMLTTAE